jgi:Domain of unknown function (DUF4340)
MVASAMRGVRARVVVVWLLLLALIAAIVFVQFKDRAATVSGDAAPAPTRMLLPMSMDDVGALEIFHAGTLHRFERDASGAWFHHTHGAAKPDDPAHAHQIDATQANTIARAFGGLSRTQREREFPAGNDAEYGLTAPEMFVLLYGKNTAQLVDKLTVGSLAPDGLSRYVLSNNYPKVVSIANYQIENLQNLLKAVGTTPAAK